MHTMVTDSIDKVLKTSEMILNEVTWKTTKEETSKMLMSVWITKNFHLILLCIYIYIQLLCKQILMHDLSLRMDTSIPVKSHGFDVSLTILTMKSRSHVDYYLCLA